MQGEKRERGGGGSRNEAKAADSGVLTTVPSFPSLPRGHSAGLKIQQRLAAALQEHALSLLLAHAIADWRPCLLLAHAIAEWGPCLLLAHAIAEWRPCLLLAHAITEWPLPAPGLRYS